VQPITTGYGPSFERNTPEPVSPNCRDAHDADGSRIIRRTYAGALGTSTAARRARDTAIREVWSSLESDPAPAMVPLHGIEVSGFDVTLVYDSFDGSLRDQLEATRMRADVALPLPAVATLRAALVAGSCAITNYELHGLELRDGELDLSDIVLRDGIPHVRASAFVDSDPARSGELTVASFGRVLTLCLTGASRAPWTLGTLRAGIPDVISETVDLFCSAPAGLGSLAVQCARARTELRRFVGRLGTSEGYPSPEPEELLRWQLSLLEGLLRLGAVGLVDRYFEERADSPSARLPAFQRALHDWDSRRSLPPVASGPLKARRSTTVADAAIAYLARAQWAYEESDMATAMVAWKCAAMAFPANPALWLEFARFCAGAGTDFARAEAFGLAEAFCASRGEAAMLRALLTRIGAGSVSDLARYFERTGHGAIANWLSCRYG
jgi:hypothetical protein